MRNRDVEPRVLALLDEHDDDWVLNKQPVAVNLDPWKKAWDAFALPHKEMLGRLSDELKAYGTVRRRFIFDLSDASDLLIATMVWGWADDTRRGPRYTVDALTEGREPIDTVIDDIRSAFDSTEHPTAKAFGQMFKDSGSGRIPKIGVSFATKILHFVGYEYGVHPLPLIYDEWAGTALARIPSAPYVPPASGYVKGAQYEAYCAWAEAYAANHGSKPVAVEWALFVAGKELAV